MNILLVGSDKIYAIENFYVHHLKNFGAHVSHFAAQSLFYDYYTKNIVNKALFKLGVSAIYRHINRQLLERVEAERPDVVWVFKGMEIFPETLKLLREKKIKLVNYNPDNPFLFSGSGSGNKNISDSISLYDLHFTYNRGIQQRLENDIRIKTEYLPFGFDVSDLLMNELAHLPEVNEACFIGNPDKDRAAFINSIIKSGVSINLYGNGWSKYIRHARAIIHLPVYGDEQWRILRKYRIQLNMMRIHNLHSHNMRTFEVPGVGGIMLATSTPEHHLFFEEGKESFFYRDADECFAKLSSLLSLPVEEANLIREAARTRSVSSGYDYQSRAHFALQEIEKL